VEAVFLESSADFVVGDGVAEHAVDHVSFHVGEPSDFAVAGSGLGGAGSRRQVGRLRLRV
jgi:hypothetical protein